MEMNRISNMGIVLCLSALALIACTQDELTREDSFLPEPVPLTLVAGKSETVVVPGTRSPYEGTWNGSETVYVQIASSETYKDENQIPWENIVPFKYSVAQDGQMTLIEGENVYWQKQDEIFYIRAWYPGTRTDYTEIPLINGTWSVSDNQSTKEKFMRDDFLYAYAALNFAPSGAGNVNFKHLMSKVVINLEGSEYLKGVSREKVSVTLGTDREYWSSQGKFRTDYSDSGYYLKLGYDTQSQNTITPYLLAQPNEGKYASYAALVVPQNITATNKYIQVTVGSATYKWEIHMREPIYRDSFLSGEQYTFNITVNAKGLNVSVEKSIGWNPDGARGDGSVVLP